MIKRTNRNIRNNYILYSTKNNISNQYYDNIVLSYNVNELFDRKIHL
ncbi:hypothetical protein A1OE_993 [Candidatus Endolissoclinum faulkneri L2]|uniref:Uncharacterized protein n=1 Tax=Candidatus Endolissoclinum faulkneri L2 TaxID=1193729 RepID=K7YRJ6_9PROT|nr:hypothetical protein A1OE_993 [Candidatus Endolissoclinum faulkneri L2]